MTIQVTPHQDGTFTVSCGVEVITVGIPRRTPAAGNAANLPEDPEEYKLGVRAFLAVRPPEWAAPKVMPVVSPTDLQGNGLNYTQQIVKHVQRHLRNRINHIGTDPLEVHIRVEPGQSIDIQSVLNLLDDDARSAGTKIVLYISGTRF